MRKLALLSGLLPCLAFALALAGCPKKGGEADAAAEAAAVAVADDAGDTGTGTSEVVVPPAKNAADVARFQNETKIDDDLQKPAVFTYARTSPKGGDVVASLKPGSDVTKFAEYQDCYLVTFPDPKDASATLMGWIEKSSFTYVAPTKAAAAKDAGAADAAVAVVDAGAAAAKCAATDALVTLSPTVTACKKKCTSDKDCKKGACSNASSAGKVVRVCAAD